MIDVVELAKRIENESKDELKVRCLTRSHRRLTEDTSQAELKAVDIDRETTRIAVVHELRERVQVRTRSLNLPVLTDD